MGASSSKTNNKIKYNQKILTKTNFDSITKILNNSVINSTVNNASKCSGELKQEQIFDMSDMKIDGDLSLDIIQKQLMAINFDCINLLSIKNNIVNDLFNKIFETISKLYTKDVITDIDQDLKNKIESGALNLSINDNNINKNIKIDQTIDSQNNTSISNVIENIIKTTLDMENVQNCISNNKQSQMINMKNVTVNGKAYLVIRQIQAADLISKCVISSDFASDITTKIIDVMDIDVKDEDEIDTEVDISDKIDQDTTSKNILDSIGTVFNDIFGGIFGGSSSTKIFSILCIICVIIIALFTVYKIYLK